MKPTLFAAAVLLMAPSLALAQDLSGDWTVSSSVGTTPITVSCTLVQKDMALSGACAAAGGGPTAFTGGMVMGTHATWGYDVAFRGQPSHVGFEADASSDTAMSGLLKLGAGKPSPFTAVKK